MSAAQFDGVLPFDVPALGVFGRLARMRGVTAEALGHHRYPQPVERLLAELLALAAALSSRLKVVGTFTLQIRGDGPVRLMVADYAVPGRLRGYARFDAAAVARLADDLPMAQFGRGTLVYTLDQGPETERYQGVVPLEGKTLAECLDIYFRRSQQMDAMVRAAARRGEDGVWRAGALIVEREPRAPGDASEAGEPWREARALGGSVAAEELTADGLTSTELVWRLYGTHAPRLHETRALEFGCRCSEGRIRDALRGFPAEDLRAMAEADGRIGATCEFCGQGYRLDPAAVLAP
ncbi:MAG: molecular chaperone [Alphaproteobacteria bacterium]|nr:molecular chaperone [Alphaproteobacteria bacterium]